MINCAWLTMVCWASLVFWITAGVQNVYLPPEPLGIGTANPSSTLHISAGGGSNAMLRIRNANKGYQGSVLQFENYSASFDEALITFDAPAGTMRVLFPSLGINRNPQLALKGNGNVGIGATTVHAPLEDTGRIIANSFAVGPYSNLNDQVGVEGTSQFGNYIPSSFVTSSADAYIYKNSNTIAGLSSGHLVFQTRSDITAGGFSFVGGSTPAPLMTILGSGQVGIGTTTSHAPLEVAGRTIADNFVVGGYSNLNDLCGIEGTMQFGNYNPSSFITASADAYIYKNSNAIGGLSSGHLIFQTRSDVSAGGFSFVGGATPAPLMTVHADGNVSIGAAASTDKLSVNGNVRAKKIIVSQTGWADYVFDDNYQLRSLSTVAQFIKENKHLPDIPSAKEVEEKGISVGDNQALLLKKIEELTLYVIDLSSQNKTMQASIKKQAEEIRQLKTKTK